MAIRCRARVSAECHHGKPEQGIYEYSQAEDGTYDRERGTVVCTPCFLKLEDMAGIILTHETLEPAIAAARRVLAERSNE